MGIKGKSNKSFQDHVSVGQDVSVEMVHTTSGRICTAYTPTCVRVDLKLSAKGKRDNGDNSKAVEGPYINGIKHVQLPNHSKY